MAPTYTHPPLIAGRLALDFANTTPTAHDLSWHEFVSFLVNARVVTPERATRLHPLLHTEPQAVDAVLLRVLRLRESIRAIFSSLVEKKPFPKNWVEPINDLLRLTEATTNLFPASKAGGWNSLPGKA